MPMYMLYFAVALAAAHKLCSVMPKLNAGIIGNADDAVVKILAGEREQMRQ